MKPSASASTPDTSGRAPRPRVPSASACVRCPRTPGGWRSRGCRRGPVRVEIAPHAFKRPFRSDMGRAVRQSCHCGCGRNIHDRTTARLLHHRYHRPDHMEAPCTFTAKRRTQSSGALVSMPPIGPATQALFTRTSTGPCGSAWSGANRPRCPTSCLGMHQRWRSTRKLSVQLDDVPRRHREDPTARQKPLYRSVGRFADCMPADPLSITTVKNVRSH